jgi:hypothetical protein
MSLCPMKQDTQSAAWLGQDYSNAALSPGARSALPEYLKSL